MQSSGKAEFLNPGGSVKDGVAVQIIEEALECGALAIWGIVTERSAGSTAISLAMVAPVYGCRCHVVIPDDAAIEKSQILEALAPYVATPSTSLTTSLRVQARWCFLLNPPLAVGTVTTSSSESFRRSNNTCRSLIKFGRHAAFQYSTLTFIVNLFAGRITIL